MTPATLVLDLDGTLAETHLDLIPTLNRTIAKAGLSPIEMSEVGYIVGKGIRPMIQRAFELHNIPIEASELERLNKAYLSDYEQNICVETVLYENVVKSLDQFLAEGWALCVCTNKLEQLAKNLLERLNISQKFVAITGADTFDFRKPDPRHLLETISQAGGNPQNAIMVGDSITDIKTAQNAEIPVIGVTFGYSDVPISELYPDATIEHYDQLFDTAVHLLSR